MKQFIISDWIIFDIGKETVSSAYRRNGDMIEILHSQVLLDDKNFLNLDNEFHPHFKCEGPNQSVYSIIEKFILKNILIKKKTTKIKYFVQEFSE